MKWLGQTILIVCLPSLVFHLEKVVYCWNCNSRYLTLCREGFLTFSKGVWFFPFKIETAQLNSIILSGQKCLLDSIGVSSFYFLHLYSLFMSVYNLQGAMSVDSITDLDDNQSRLLEALQLSLPAEAQNKKEKARDKKLSLNPIYRQVPRLVDSCCQHLEKHGKQTWVSAIKYFHVFKHHSFKHPISILYSFDQALGRNFLCEESLHSVGISPVGINKIWWGGGGAGGGDKLDDIQTP